MSINCTEGMCVWYVCVFVRMSDDWLLMTVMWGIQSMFYLVDDRVNYTSWMYVSDELANWCIASLCVWLMTVINDIM